MNPLELSIQQKIKWKEAKEEAGTDQITLTGTFEHEGKTYEVSIKYSKDAIQGEAEPFKTQVWESFNKVGTEALAKLSGMTVKTTLDDLRQKKYQILKDNKEIQDWGTKDYANTVTDIQNIFASVFEKLSPEEQALKDKIGEQAFNRIRKRLLNIEDLIKKHDPDKIEEFYRLLTNRVENEKSLKISCYERTPFPLDDFLEIAEESLLKDSSFISSEFIDGTLHQLVKDQEGVDYLNTNHFLIKEDKDSHKPARPEDLIFSKGDDPKKVLIPVNVANKHWILYTLDLTDPDSPKLTSYDSKPETTRPYQKQIQELERSMITTLKERFKLGEVVLTPEVEEVTEQVSNNCGVHVCRNAEWFAKDQNEFEASTAESFTPHRLTMLLETLK